MTVNSEKSNNTHILIIEDDQGRREMILKKSRYSIGRTQQCDVIIYSPFVSRHHASIIRHMDQENCHYYEIFDGDGRKLSANGILVNGEKVTQRNLKNGDKVVFAPEVFVEYQYRQQDDGDVLLDDPFDITLIDPAMIGDDSEDDTIQYKRKT